MGSVLCPTQPNNQLEYFADLSLHTQPSVISVTVPLCHQPFNRPDRHFTIADSPSAVPV